MSVDVTVRELKARLSDCLRRVRAGEEVVVTLRGRRVARIVAEPEFAATEDDDAEIVARLDELPWVNAPEAAGRPSGATDPIRVPEGERLSSELLERE